MSEKNKIETPDAFFPNLDARFFVLEIMTNIMVKRLGLTDTMLEDLDEVVRQVSAKEEFQKEDRLALQKSIIRHVEKMKQQLNT